MGAGRRIQRPVPVTRLTQIDPPKESGGTMRDEVLTFWLEDTDPKAWWVADPAFDEKVRQRFAPLLASAAQGELYEWRTDPEGRLAEIIVLDQFSRNIHRGTPAAFAQDAMALVLAQEAIARGDHEQLEKTRRALMLLPYMHSESRAIHIQAEQLYRDHAPASNYDFELRHKVIIDRFGRYPHRNSVLGRQSTAEEIEFLKQPGSSF
jgi:uncharacterized protein (DUF924 family)